MKNCCDECQMTISDAFDSSQEECAKLLSQWQTHIDQCEPCTQFFIMWNPSKSPLSAIAKQSYTPQLSPQRLNSVMDEVHTREPTQVQNIVQIFFKW